MSTSCCTECECQTCQSYRHFLYQVARLFIKTCVSAQHKSSFHSSDASDPIITIYNSTWIRKQKSPPEAVSLKQRCYAKLMTSIEISHARSQQQCYN